jgi:transketolase
MPIKRVGIEDRFGESGAPSELMEYFGLTGEKLVPTIEEFIDKMPRYHQA